MAPKAHSLKTRNGGHRKASMPRSPTGPCSVTAGQTTLNILLLFIPSLAFKEENRDFRASWKPLNYPCEALVTPGSIPGNRAAVILGIKPENSWKS